ncbi:MAG: hypothetical protein JOY99_01385 [Sphingomonadaceae bacterium]|nr:hypothetical protein [Sphingomonadaceae bacterium]
MAAQFFMPQPTALPVHVFKPAAAGQRKQDEFYRTRSSASSGVIYIDYVAEITRAQANNAISHDDLEINETPYPLLINAGSLLSFVLFAISITMLFFNPQGAVVVGIFAFISLTIFGGFAARFRDKQATYS